MIRYNQMMRVAFIVGVLLCIPAQAQPTTDEYSESYVVTLHWCHYLEYVHEFTTHMFLVRILFDGTQPDAQLSFTGRYFFSNTSYLLNSSSERYRTIKFEVYELVNGSQLLCDLTEEEGIGSAEITFDTFTGHWTGDDHLGDDSGYGRLNGCDDGSLTIAERDFELGLSLQVVDPDGDGIPRWMEEQVYCTDPLSNDADRDDDHDEVPLLWEWRYGFDPFVYEDHRHTDADDDGLTTYEEYLVSPWYSDPFRKDIFLELDQMKPGPNTDGFSISRNTTIMVYQVYAQRNIMFHVDDGCMGGGELIPYKRVLWFGEEKEYYSKYFLHNDPANWRRGVFRYALYVNNHVPISGMEFPGENSILQFYRPGLNSYVIATVRYPRIDFAGHACIMLHELGHTLGIYIGHPLGCDNQLMRNPFSIQKIIFKNYRSVMNYQYTYEILDYSDGSHGFGDYDDWGTLDLTFFQPDGTK